jgi:competence protein ComEC
MDTGRARERARTWPLGRAKALAGSIRWTALDALARRFIDAFRVATIAEAAPGRLVPWVPVAFGVGIAAYFTAEREPSSTAAVLLASGLLVAGFVARRPAIAFAALVLIAAATAGFAVATLKTALIAHPVLERSIYGASVTGFIEAREERERTDRIIVKVIDMDGDRVESAGPTNARAPRRRRGPGRRRLCEIESSTQSAAASIAARRIRLRSRSLLSAHWRDRVCDRCHQD